MPRIFEDVRSSLQKLDTPVILDLLASAAINHPDVMSSIQAATDANRNEESSRIINFDNLSKSIWHDINVRFSQRRPSQQYNMAVDVFWGVVDATERIKKACGPSASPQTRYNGLSVLRKIGKTLCLSANANVIGKAVIKDAERESLLEQAMMEVVKAMGAEERWGIRRDEETRKSLWPKMLELQRLANSYHIMGGLQGVLDALEDGLDDTEVGRRNEDDECSLSESDN